MPRQKSAELKHKGHTCGTGNKEGKIEDRGDHNNQHFLYAFAICLYKKKHSCCKSRSLQYLSQCFYNKIRKLTGAESALSVGGGERCLASGAHTRIYTSTHTKPQTRTSICWWIIHLAVQQFQKEKKRGGNVWGSFKEKYGRLQKKSTNQAPKKMTLDEVPAHSSWLR